MLIGANIAVYLIEALSVSSLTRFVYALGLVPAILSAERSYTLLTYMYLHADPLHLFTNMIVLWMFGVECEREYGAARFLLLYHASGVSGGLLHTLIFPQSRVAVVGASGAVFGLVAAFAVLFPTRPIAFLIGLLPIPLPAAVWGALYFLLELAYGLSGVGYVAHMAHVGGFIVGALFALPRRRRGPERHPEVKIVWEKV